MTIEKDLMNVVDNKNVPWLILTETSSVATDVKCFACK